MTERILTYRPGTWLAIVGLNATVLLPNSEKARVGALWERIDAGAEFDGVLDALVAGGLSSLPGFVLFGEGAEPGSTRVVVRGEAEVNFESDDDIITVTSNSTEMWRERTVAADQFEVALPGEEAEGPELAVLGGLVRVGRLATSTPTNSPSLASTDDSAQLAPVLHLAVPPTVAETGAPLILPPVPPISVADLPPVPTSVEPEVEAEPEVEPEPELDVEIDDAELPTDRFEALDAEAVEAHVGEAVPAPVAAPEHDLDEDEDDLPTDVFPAYTDAVPAEVADYDEGPTDVIDEPGEVDLDDLSEDIDPEDVDPDAETGDLEGGAIPAAPIIPPAPVIPPAPIAAPAVAVPPAPPAAPAEPASPPVAAEPVRPQAPKLSFSHGAEVEVVGLVVVGRNPDPRRFADTEQPHLVVVPSPHSEISSTHVEIRPGAGQHAGQAIVTDLGSTNGTLVVQPGEKPEEISPGVPVALRSGALIDLGDGMTIRVR